MMAAKRLLRIICCCLFIVNGQNSDIKTNNLNENEKESYKQDIAAVFSHLNSTPYEVYIYKEATLLFAHKKNDITELSLDINVECKNIYPGVPCIPGSLTCHAFIQQTSEGERQVLNDVNCKPKPDIFIEEIPLRKPTESGNAVNEPKMFQIDLTNEAVSSVTDGDHFVAVKKNASPCLGCPHDLNPNVDGVDELVQTVLRHVESERNNKHALIKIIRLQQQVVAGFKYFLTVEIAPTVCSKDSSKLLSDCAIDNEKGSSICEVVFWHQPWDSNVKHIIHNNCTISQEFDSLDNTLSNDIKNIKSNSAVASNFNDMDNTGNHNEIDPGRLADLESQIVIEADDGASKPIGNAVQAIVSTSTEHADSRLETSTTEQKSTKKELFLKENESSVIKTITDLNVEDEDSSENRREKRSKNKSSSSESSESSQSSKGSSKSSSESVESSERNRTVKENVEPLKVRVERAIPPMLKIPPEEKHFVSHLADFAANALDEMDDDNNKRIVLQNLGGKKMMDNDGVYYNLIMRMGVSECLEEEPFSDKCRQKLLENYTKICKVQIFVNDDILSPKLVKSRCQNIKRDKSNNSNRTNFERYKRQIKSEQKSKNVDKYFIKNMIKNALDYLNEDREESKQFKFDKIKSTNWYTSENLTHYKLKVKLFKGTEKKICKVKIIVNDVGITTFYKIKCQDEIYQFNTDNGRQKRQIPGGPVETSLENTAFFDDLLEDSLFYLDSKSENRNKLKIQKVTSATKQVVAGIIHRVEAKVIPTSCEKQETGKHRKNCNVLEGAEPITCKFKIYDIPWIPNSKETTIDCGAKNYFFTGRPGTNQSLPNSDRIKRELLGDDSDYTYSIMFDKFVQKYKRNYNKTEFNYRLKVFKDNIKYIRMLNTFEQGTAWYGITHFADLTRKEFSKSHGLRTELRDENVMPFRMAKIPDIDLPDEFDWRSKGVITEVKNQEQCGSCWAFSVTGNIEGQYAIKHQNLLEFSEQELVDCDTEDQGCNGGLMDTAYRVIEKLGGLETEKDYPYDAKDEKCHFNKTLVNVQLTGAVNISQNETNMAKWLVANGPISIAINANAMQFYMGGVSHPFKFLCNPKNLDHGVLVVGYGVHTYPLFKKSLPYWIVKNSWGTGWGEQGYYRVYRGDGTCGVNQTPSSAIVV